MDATPAANAGMFADAQAYERYMGRLSRRLAPLLLDFAQLAPATRILDLGCGTGALAAALLARDPALSVAGVDLSPGYVSHAQAMLPGRRASFAVGDAQRLSFAPAAFDAALSLLVLNFIPDPRQALAELRRVVRPRGVIAAAVWDYGEGMQPLRVFWDAAAALDPAAGSRDERNQPLCRAGELRDIWQAAGLQEVVERSLETPARFESVDEFWEPFLLGQGPAGAYAAALPKAQQAQLRDELTRRLPRPPITLKARAWAVRGLN